jgi:ribosomal protein S18 acetylase RimI-like enzyme
VSVSLREVCADDAPLLLALYASTREAEMAMVAWTAEQKRAFVEMQFAAQRQSYANSYPNADHCIVCADGEPAGRIYLSRTDGRLHIVDITIAPERRNQGIGSEVLAGIIAEADAHGKPVSIYVESFNPSLRLFERLGFGVASVDGYLLKLERPATRPDDSPRSD